MNTSKEVRLVRQASVPKAWKQQYDICDSFEYPLGYVAKHQNSWVTAQRLLVGCGQQPPGADQTIAVKDRFQAREYYHDGDLVDSRWDERLPGRLGSVFSGMSPDFK
jgi:hypothetical protein